MAAEIIHWQGLLLRHLYASSFRQGIWSSAIEYTHADRDRTASAESPSSEPLEDESISRRSSRLRHVIEAWQGGNGTASTHQLQATLSPPAIAQTAASLNDIFQSLQQLTSEFQQGDCLSRVRMFHSMRPSLHALSHPHLPRIVHGALGYSHDSKLAFLRLDLQQFESDHNCHQLIPIVISHREIHALISCSSIYPATLRLPAEKTAPCTMPNVFWTSHPRSFTFCMRNGFGNSITQLEILQRTHRRMHPNPPSWRRPRASFRARSPCLFKAGCGCMVSHPHSSRQHLKSPRYSVTKRRSSQSICSCGCVHSISPRSYPAITLPMQIFKMSTATLRSLERSLSTLDQRRAPGSKSSVICLHNRDLSENTKSSRTCL